MAGDNIETNNKYLGVITPSIYKGKVRKVSEQGEARKYGSWLVEHGIKGVENVR